MAGVGAGRCCARPSREARKDDLSTTAQALAYSFFLAIPSIFLVVLGVFSLVASPDDVTRLMDRVERIAPPEAAQLLGDSLQRTISSSRLGPHARDRRLRARALVDDLGRDDADEGRHVGVRPATTTAASCASACWRCCSSLCFLAAALLVVGLLVLGPSLQGWVGGAIGAPHATAWIWWTAQWPILVGALLFLFAVLLYLGPDVQQPRWQLVTPGAAVSLVIWLVASGGFAVYTSHFGSYNKAWGTLSAVVITLSGSGSRASRCCSAPR